jgi:hypothetical protein
VPAARVVVVLDNARSDRLNQVIRTGEHALKQDGVEAARTELKAVKKRGKSGDEKALAAALAEPVITST